jgi:hypothetical protein
MTRSGWVTGIAAVAAVAALAASGWRVLESRDSSLCRVCERPVHGNTRAQAVVGGSSRPYCCPACALSEHMQSGLPAEVVLLTDFDTGRPLAPKDAVVVRGSDVRSCSHAATPIAEDKRRIEMIYDRCSPSLLAFASRAAAERFAASHGGEVVEFRTLAVLYR